MSLKKNIENAFLNTIGYDQIDDMEARKNMKQKAQSFGKDVSDAIVEFLQAQEFTITKMKAIVSLDELRTTGKLSGDIKNSTQCQIPIGVVANPAPIPLPINPVTTKKAVDIPKLKLNRSGGQGGSMTAVGYAYVGRNNPVSPNESGEDKTIVQLIDVKEK